MAGFNGAFQWIQVFHNSLSFLLVGSLHELSDQQFFILPWVPEKFGQNVMAQAGEGGVRVQGIALGENVGNVVVCKQLHVASQPPR